MIIDCHTHIFPSEIRQNREKFFPREPAFDLLYAAPGSRLVGAEELLEAMDENQVDRSVVFGFPWCLSDTFEKHNDYIMASVQKHPDRLVGLGCFDAAAKGAAAETERCLSGGLRGIGELAFYQAGIDAAALDQLTPIMERCRAHNVPAMIHINEPVGHHYHGKTPVTLAQVYQLVKRFPENKIVLAHWGGGLFFFSLMKKEVKKSLANVYFDTAASPYLYDSKIYRLAMDLIGPGKILFGSDYPLLPPLRYFKEMEQVNLSKAEIDAICGGNADRLFWST